MKGRAALQIRRYGRSFAILLLLIVPGAAPLVPPRPADLVPNTPLKDMEVNIAPGAPSGGVRADPGRAGRVPTSAAGFDADRFSSLITELDNGTRGGARTSATTPSATKPRPSRPRPTPAT